MIFHLDDMDYNDRIKDLGYSDYKIAQLVAEQRTLDGNPTTTQQVYSAVCKCLNDPELSSLKLNLEIIEALGGTIGIQWSL